MVALLLQAEPAGATSAAVEALRSELMGMKISQLRTQALAAGVEVGVVEEAEDSDDPRESMVSLILEQGVTGTARLARAQGGTSRDAARLALGTEPEPELQRPELPSQTRAVQSSQRVRFRIVSTWGAGSKRAGLTGIQLFDADGGEVGIGLGRIVALCDRSSTLYQIHEHIRCLCF
jgi:hypothetical protein